MSLNLRGSNFVSEIKGINIIQDTIKGLFDGDNYYFATNVNGVTRVFLVQVVEYPNGKADFILKRDFTKFFTNPDTFNKPPSDEIIKVLSNNPDVGTVGYPMEVIGSAVDPAAEMAEYVTTYLDALQTIGYV